MKVIVLITLCLFAILSLARAGEHGHIHAVAGEFGYKVRASWTKWSHNSLSQYILSHNI